MSASITIYFALCLSWDRSYWSLLVQTRHIISLYIWDVLLVLILGLYSYRCLMRLDWRQWEPLPYSFSQCLGCFPILYFSQCCSYLLCISWFHGGVILALINCSRDDKKNCEKSKRSLSIDITSWLGHFRLPLRSFICSVFIFQKNESL